MNISDLQEANELAIRFNVIQDAKQSCRQFELPEEGLVALDVMCKHSRVSIDLTGAVTRSKFTEAIITLLNEEEDIIRARVNQL